MDYYVKQFLTTNKLGVGVPFRVIETDKLVEVKEDGSFINCTNGEVLNLGDVFSILSGAYHIELDNAKYLTGDTYYFVYDIDTIKKATWDDNIYDYALLSMGNVFDTRFEADNHKEEILSKCKDINTKDTLNKEDTVDTSEDTNKEDTNKVNTLSDAFDTATLLNKTISTATQFNDSIKKGLSGMALSIDKDSVDKGKYKGYTLHNGVKKDFDINATTLGEAIREALKRSFN